MDRGDNTESRIETALKRLHDLSSKLSERPAQGSLMMGDESVLKAEVDNLKVENQLLRQELLELTASYNGLKQATDAASGRLDKAIKNVAELLEQ
ncbi:DUF4164 family protein [Sneathiella limimaris]|uniref:DUF4164 family protein n=1 Tax=Sneathiella limimaris TaxID=1964213 RepID=UPI00146F0781|nr:DUF4164 family protein [Sneathiella limimaris]